MRTSFKLLTFLATVTISSLSFSNGSNFSLNNAKVDSINLSGTKASVWFHGGDSDDCNEEEVIYFDLGTDNGKAIYSALLTMKSIDKAFEKVSVIYKGSPDRACFIRDLKI